VALGIAQHNSSAWQLAALIAASSLQVYQILWTFFMGDTNLESIAANDFRVRHSLQATYLLGITKAELKVFLTMISPWRSVKVHGDNNSYIDSTEMGVLSIEGKMPIDIIYVAGYITTSVADKDSFRMPLGVWVPYDTHRLVYGSNDKVRRLAVIDGSYHLSKSYRTAIEFTGGGNNDQIMGKNDSDGAAIQFNGEENWDQIMVKHDSDLVLPVSTLAVFSEGEIG
jgi:hypothetical protein